MALRESLLALLSAPDATPLDETALARRLGLKSKQRASLRHEIRLLLAAGTLIYTQGDRLRLAGQEGECAGRLRFRANGWARVFPESDSADPTAAESAAITIAPDDTGLALPDDRVVVRLSLAERSGGRSRGTPRGAARSSRTGIVVRVLDRGHEHVVGVLRGAAPRWRLVVDDPNFPREVQVLPPAPDRRNAPTLTAGDKVVVRLAPWNDRREPLTGSVVEHLGRQYAPAAELRGIFAKFDLPVEFPAEVRREAAALPTRVRPADTTDRRDFRSIPTFTIDPDDAKDFDDALSLETLDQGAVRVGIHIADVAHYVPPGSALDREARRRGNSTYLVGTVVPMLPERLSNGLCSLVEGEDRLTQAVLLTFDRQGQIKHTEFAATVIRSRHRLTYRQAFGLLQQNDFEALRALPAPPPHQTGHPGRPLASLSDLELVDLQSMLRKLWALAKRLRAARFARGSLDLDLPETKIFVDPEGYAERLEKVVHDESHQLIEEFMLAANEAVARLTRTHRLASLYRVHDDPDERKLDEYRQFAATFGLVTDDLTRPGAIPRLLAAAAAHPQSHLLRSQFLRSLRKACYRATPDGHFGLAQKDYTHFTSPIRRYADLVVHRVLRQHLVKTGTLPALPESPTASHPSAVPPAEGSLPALAEHLSLTESNSQEAERESERIKLLEFFERQLERRDRTRFQAVITEVRLAGLFIELVDSLTFGLVAADTLPGDHYAPNPSGTALLGRRTKRRFELGATIEVVVHRVDRARRFIDFRIA